MSLASSFAALMRSLSAGFSEEAIAALDVPVLIPWGANDPFAPVAGAHRFHKELPGARSSWSSRARAISSIPTRPTAAREVTQFLNRL